MRVGLLVAGVLSAVAVPSEAATIVQTRTIFNDSSLTPFDSALGQLNSVTIAFDLVRSRRFANLLGVPTPDAPAVIPIHWDISGNYVFTGPGNDVRLIPLTAQGDFNFSADGSARGASMIARGPDTIFVLDPKDYTDTGPIFFNMQTPGLFNPTLDNTFSTDVDLQAYGLRIAGYQGCEIGVSDSCNYFRATLTYDYTPGVPEPATWTMMLVGFAMAGSSLRKRPRKAVAGI